MPRHAAALSLGLAVLALSGCLAGPASTSSTAPETSATTSPPVSPCPAAPGPVPGFTAQGGAWANVSLPDQPNALCGTADRALSHLVRDNGTFSDVELRVRFQMLAGDSGAGVVLHVASEQDLVIVRYSPREQGWHLFTIVAGNRQKQDEASVTPPTTNPELMEWVDLRVVSKAGHVTAWHGDVMVIDYELPPSASHQGRVGYFLRDTGMAAHFAGLQVTPG